MKDCFCIGPQNGEPVCPCLMKEVQIQDGRYVMPKRDLGPVVPVGSTPADAIKAARRKAFDEAIALLPQLNRPKANDSPEYYKRYERYCADREWIKSILEKARDK